MTVGAKLAGAPASSPRTSAERVLAGFVAAVEAGRLADAVACFAEDARFVTPDGTVVAGVPQLSNIMRQVLALPRTIAIAPERIIDFGQTAIATQVWTMRFHGPEDGDLERTSIATVALRRGRPRWEMTLIAPWGLAGGRVR
ncbi:MAG TPA: nuclear transport factor 2 family protein [Solirubrobacterales bacterium]|nr:nuclear transport factor 2 family protein [Solirubrobacterales bacterium]